MAERTAHVTWSGSLMDGSGLIESTGSGAIGGLEVTWAARSEPDESGRTSPEELIAAAHAACFCMALSHGLAQAGNPPEKLDVTATSTFVPGTGITQMKLDVTGTRPGHRRGGVRHGRRGSARQLPRLGRAQGQRRDPARRATRELGAYGLRGGRRARATASPSGASKISRASASNSSSPVSSACSSSVTAEPERDAELPEDTCGDLVARCDRRPSAHGSASPGHRDKAAVCRAARSRSGRAAPRSFATLRASSAASSASTNACFVLCDADAEGLADVDRSLRVGEGLGRLGLRLAGSARAVRGTQLEVLHVGRVLERREHREDAARVVEIDPAECGCRPPDWRRLRRSPPEPICSSSNSSIASIASSQRPSIISGCVRSASTAHSFGRLPSFCVIASASSR